MASTWLRIHLIASWSVLMSNLWPSNYGCNDKTAHTSAKKLLNCCIVVPFRPVQLLWPKTEWLFRSVRMFMNQDTTYLLIARIRVKGQESFGTWKTITGADSTLSCHVFNASWFSCIRVSNVHDSPILTVLLSSAVMRFGTHRRSTLRSPRSELDSVTLRAGFQLRIAWVV